MPGSRKRVREEDLFCARCHRPVRLGANHWPEGYICQKCLVDALETYGTCARCGVHRMTPGITEDGSRLCADCAGGLCRYFCQRCGREARRYRAGICGNCVLAERLQELLDDGTGAIRPELVPFYEAFREVSRPTGGLTWARTQHIERKLRALATGETPLTHEGIDQLGTPQSTAYLRDLLMQYGVLPRGDRHLLMFETWLTDRLATTTDPGHRKLISQYATWDVLRKLRDIAARKEIGPSRLSDAKARITRAAELLDWLADRGHTPSQCTQGDLDAWHGEHRSTRRTAQPFLRWCMRTGNMPKLSIPNIPTANPAPLSQHRRIALIKRFLTDDQIPLIDRVTATLVLLYAQPVSRILRLTTSDITTGDDGTVLLRLGDPPSPMPAPFATLLTQYAATRPNTRTATNPDSVLLFPGRRAGQPLHPSTLRTRLHAHGLETGNTRAAVLRQLVLQAPAPVVARMLGYNDASITRIAAEASTPWSQYSPGNHGK